MDFKGSRVLAIHKELLRGFWDEFGYHKNGLLTCRKLASPKRRDAVIASLVKMGTIELHYKSTHDRADFEKRKHHKQFSGFKSCFACKNSAEVRHHIIWLRHGGRNQRNNIVGLCRPCHAQIHPWLLQHNTHKL